MADSFTGRRRVSSSNPTDKEKSDSVESADTEPTSLIDNLAQINELATGGPPKPDLTPDFEPSRLISWEESEAIRKGESALDDSEAWKARARAGYLNNNTIAPFDAIWTQEALLPSLGESIQGRIQQAIDFVTDLEDQGFNNPFGEAGTASFYTQMDIISSLSSGVAVDHRLAYEANVELWKEHREEFEQYSNQFNVNRFRLEESEEWQMVMRDFGDKMEPDFVDGLIYLFDHNVDNEGLRGALGQLLQYIGANPKGLEGREKLNDYLVYWAQVSGQAAMNHQVNTGQLDPPDAPSWREVGKGLFGVLGGIADVLPEERLGLNFEGGIVSGGGTALGKVASLPVASEIFKAGEFLFTPIDKYITDPVEQLISNYSADVNNDPYRGWISDGQNLALSLGFKWGSDGFNNASGIMDAVVVLGTDPATYLIPYAKALKVAKFAPIGAQLASRGQKASRVVRAEKALAAANRAGDAGAIARAEAKLAKVSKSTRARSLQQQAILPNALQKRLYGSALPTPWSGQKGPITRFFYYGHAELLDDLLDAEKGKWAGFLDDVVNHGDRAEDLVRMHPFLTKSTGLTGALENIFETVTDPVQRRAVAKQALMDASAGLLDDPKSATAASVARNVEKAEDGANDALRGALERGDIAPSDLGTLQIGNHAYDGFTGYKMTGAKGRLVPLLSDGDDVLLFPAKTKLASADDVRKALDASTMPGSGPRLLGEAMDQGLDVGAVWDDLGPLQQQRTMSWIHAHGFDGINMGGNNLAFTDEAIRGAIATVDGPPTRALTQVLGGPLEELGKARRASSDMLSGTDSLTWINELPMRSLSSKLYGGLATGVRRGFEKTFGDVRTRRTLANLTAKSEGFPQSVDWTDVNKGAEDLRMIALRKGVSAEDAAEMVAEFKRTVPAKRRDVLLELKQQINAKVGDWRDQYLHSDMNADRHFMGGQDANGKALGAAKSNTTDDLLETAFEPSMMTNEVYFWPEAHYTELGRLNKARRSPFMTKGYVNGIGPIKGSKSRRAQLADRYERLVRSKMGDAAADGIGKRDFYNMAYATATKVASGGGEAIDGLGAISQATNFVSRWHKLAQSKFSLLALVLRAPAWALKVAIFEEPIRGQLTGSTRWYSNPLGAMKDTVQASMIGALARDAESIPRVLESMRTQVLSQFDSAADLVDAKNFLKSTFGAADSLLDDIDNIADLRQLAGKLTGDALQNFNPRLSGKISFSGKMERTANRIERLGKDNSVFRLTEIEDFGMGLDDVMSFGYNGMDTATAASIYQRSLFDSFRQRFDSSRAYVPLAWDDASMEAYAVAKGTQALTNANDPWHRFAVEYHLADMNGTVKPSITEFMLEGKWENLRPNIERIARHRKVKFKNQDELATWYVREFQREVIEARWGGLTSDLGVPRQQVLQGVLDRKIVVNGAQIPLSKTNELGTIRGYRAILQEARDSGNKLPNFESNVVGIVTPQRIQQAPTNWRIHSAIREGLDAVGESMRLTNRVDDAGRVRNGIMEYAGARATQNVSRLPGWRRIYGNYRRKFDAMGWDPKKSDAAARTYATQSINNIYYNSGDMPNILSKFNEVVPFGAAMFEVAKVWMWDIPKNHLGHGGFSGWVTGSYELGRRWDYFTQAMEGMGLVEIRENEETGGTERIVTLGGEGATWQSRFGGAVFSAPSNLVKKFFDQTTDADLEGYERIEFKLGTITGNIFNADNEGLFALGQFQVGMAPHIAFAGQKILPSVLGATVKKDFAGGTVAELLEDTNMELEEFLTIPMNRQILKEAGYPLDGLSDLIRDLREDPEAIESIEHAAWLRNITDLVIPAGKYHMENPGAQMGFVQDFIYPYGAPQNIAEVIGDYAPVGIQNALMGLEQLLSDKDAWSPSAFFFGAQAANRQDAEIINGIMVNAWSDGLLGKWRETVDRGTELRMLAVENGWANMNGPDGARFDWDIDPETEDAAAAIAAELEEINKSLNTFQGNILGDAITYSAGAHLMKGITQSFMPISPRTFTAQQDDMNKYWGSRDFAEALREGHGDDAFTRWNQSMKTVEDYEAFSQVVVDFLAPAQWDPAADDRTKAYYDTLATNTEVKRAFLNNPTMEHLHFWLTPSKVYPTGYVPTETVEEWANSVQAGALQFAEPEVFMMRALSSSLSWELAVERAAMFEQYDDFTGVLDNWSEYSAMSLEHRHRRDYLDFVDEEVFGGALRQSYEQLQETSSGKPDALEIVRESTLAARDRDLEMLQGLIDDIEDMNLDPLEAKELRNALFTAKDEIEQMVAWGSELNEYSAITEDEQNLTRWFDTVLGPHYEKLGGLYELVDGAQSGTERSVAYEAIRMYENSHYRTQFTVNGIDVPNVYKWTVGKLRQEAEDKGTVEGTKLEVKAQRLMGTKIDWMSASDIDLLGNYVDLAGGSLDRFKQVFPTEPTQWLPYNVRNDGYVQIEALRIAGQITNKQYNDLKDGYDQVLIDMLNESDRGEEVDFLNSTPAEQQAVLGILPEILAPLQATGSAYLADIRAKNEAKIKHNKKDIWLQEVNPLLQDYLRANPKAATLVRELGLNMYKTDDTNDILYRWLLGKFSDV